MNTNLEKALPTLVLIIVFILGVIFLVVKKDWVSSFNENNSIDRGSRGTKIEQIEPESVFYNYPAAIDTYLSQYNYLFFLNDSDRIDSSLTPNIYDFKDSHVLEFEFDSSGFVISLKAYKLKDRKKIERR